MQDCDGKVQSVESGTCETSGTDGAGMHERKRSAFQKQTDHTVHADAPDNPEGKLNKVVANVMAEYQKAEEQGIIGTQLIFSDIGTPKGAWNPEGMTGSFDVYNYIKTKLVENGIPAWEIAYIHDAKTDAAKENLS